MRRDRKAFTLIELLVVIGIIAVLVGIGIAVGRTVVDTGRAQATRNTLTVTETILANLEGDTDLSPRDYRALTVSTSQTGGMELNLPLVDGRLDSAGTARTIAPEPSLGRFLAFVEKAVPGSDSAWKQLDAQIVRPADIGLPSASLVVDGTEIVDQWDNPLRFVHPSFDGGHGDWRTMQGANQSRDALEIDLGGPVGSLEYRRSFRPFDPTAADASQQVGDADEGLCVSGRPYFYSAGPDGDPGTREDNVYGDQIPQFPAETDGK
jgi:prepilin-type N-terminal cleavage/methylation domain-containing protein